MLTIIQSKELPNQKKISQWEQRRITLEAKYERAWLINPEQFLPDVLEIERLKRTWDLMLPFLQQPKIIADLASGVGSLIDPLLELGHKIHAVDVASNALKRLTPHPNLATFQQALPKTTLNDYTYDLVLALDLLTELHPDDYRLFMSEIQRLMKRDGFALISTPLDSQTIDPLAIFLDLLSSEFNICDLTLSHHSSYLKFRRLNQKWLIRSLETFTRFFKPQSGITHVIALVTKKSLF